MPSTIDRRSSIIEITESGLGALREVRRLIHAHERDWMSALPEAELRAYIVQLHRIQDSLVESDGDS